MHNKIKRIFLIIISVFLLSLGGAITIPVYAEDTSPAATGSTDVPATSDETSSTSTGSEETSSAPTSSNSSTPTSKASSSSKTSSSKVSSSSQSSGSSSQSKSSSSSKTTSANSAGYSSTTDSIAGATSGVDWAAVLSGSSNDASEGAFLSTTNNAGPGFSKLFYIGLGACFLGVCGIIYFIVAQVIAKKKKSALVGATAGASVIASAQRREETISEEEPEPMETGENIPVIGDSTGTVEERSDFSLEQDNPGQETPSEGDFDWDKFFKDHDGLS